MKRECTRCNRQRIYLAAARRYARYSLMGRTLGGPSIQRPFAAEDLAREETEGMEAERKAAGLGGVRFVYYRCPNCGMNDIFVDILPRPGESDDDFWARRDEMEAVVRRLHDEQAEAVVDPPAEA
jgi:hypothetical protein